MGETKLDTRFFESTRGQIVTLLRRSAKTVNEIAGELKLTDNAIRAHLLSLERDRLVEQKGAVKGFRKPHNTYGLTDEARHLFPKPYAFLFNELLDALKKTLPKATLQKVLRDVGQDIGHDNLPGAALEMDDRLNEAVNVLEALGGAAGIIRENGKTIIKSEGCPFDEAVAEHPEVCKVAESMIEEIVGSGVKETCDRTAAPKCRFLIDAP